MDNTIEFEKSSGNVFADLDLDNAENLEARSLVGIEIIKIMNETKKTQKEWGQVLGLKQAEVSHLLNGHFSRFTLDKLFSLLNKMNKKVTITISSHKQGEVFNQVFLG